MSPDTRSRRDRRPLDSGGIDQRRAERPARDLTLELILENRRAEQTYTPSQALGSLLGYLEGLPAFDDDAVPQLYAGLGWRLKLLRNSALREADGAPYLHGVIAGVEGIRTAIAQSRTLSSPEVRDAFALLELEISALIPPR